MTFGTIESVEARPLGSSLTDDAPVGATTLTVEFAADFDEDGGQLALGDLIYDYTAIDSDTGVITLASPLPVAALAEDPVRTVDTGEVAVEWVANVATDEGDTISAVIPTALISYFPEGSPSEATSVEIALRDGVYEVRSQPQTTPSFDGGTVWNPNATRSMTSVVIPDGVWTQITGWTTDAVDGITLDDGANVVYPGMYLLLVRAAFAANGVGRRGVRILADTVVRETFITDADSSGTTSVPVFDSARLGELSKVTVEVIQTSGAALTMGSGSFNMFRTSI